MSSSALAVLCSVNPESLGPGTPVETRFRYIDISSVDCGRIDWNNVREMVFSEAPSRARRIVRPGDVLFCTVRPGLMAHGRISETKSELVCSTGFAVLRAHCGSDSSFLFHQLFSERVAGQYRALETGSNYPAINERDIHAIQIFIPEQIDRTRIARILDTADALIAKSEAIIAKLRRVRSGLLHDLLTRGLDANGNLRDPAAHPEQFKDSPLGRIPKKWEVDFLVNRISFPEGQVDPKYEPYSGYVLVAPDHIESETGRLLARETAEEQGAISGKYLFQPGDVLYSKIRPYLRKAVLAHETGLCSADMYPLRPRKEVNANYLLAVILGEEFSRFASAVSMRSGFPKINRQEMAEYRLAWPPIDEQDAIAANLSTHDRMIASEEAELAKLCHLKSGLMTDLLEGRVRVDKLPS